MRQFWSRPTWEEVKQEDWMDEEYEWLQRTYPDEYPPMPEPTMLGLWLKFQVLWLIEEARYFRCRKGHKYGPWENLFDDPEYVDTGDPLWPYAKLQGRMTGRIRSCARCGHQHGQGEY